ncbi:DUF4124 domain-containing protein [Chitinilyticum piscinae]|uniref:DUF4124 domain-containing protein n=1 Tax=Chitinilyticum piscinae TaxID=2866724 RepID=A0A8J7K9J2_9NEIS|nr:DUF4124 domain-containing protein [Chitinilyticum piscinae]MBE9608209.1 DUF4124 domain-containing protein [Chitinilyticum piscinae]
MSRLLLSLLLCFVAGSAFAKMYRWVDEKGQVQYSDKPPSGVQKVSEVDRNGRVRTGPDGQIMTDDERAKVDAEKRKQLELERRDKALLQTYNSLEEFDARRDLQLDAVKAGITSNEMRRKTVAERLQKQQAQADGYQKRKRAVPDDLNSEIELTRKEIADIDRNIAKQKEEMDLVQQRTEADKKRWSELKAKQNQPR